MAAPDDKHIFVWRSERKDEYPTEYLNCPWCGSSLSRGGNLLVKEVLHGGIRRDATYKAFTNACPLCGWTRWGQRYVKHRDLEYPSHFGSSFGGLDVMPKFAGGHYLGGDDLLHMSVLKQFSVNSPQLPLKELGTYLKKNFSDIYSLSPRRFEEVVDNVFKAHGYRTVLTQASKDDGADIVIVTDDDKTVAIVECKKYAKERKVGVELVKQLMGTAVQWNLKRASLVTTSDFTSGARAVARDYNSKGYEFDLVAATDILKLFQVYNEKLPPLDKLDKKVRREIIESNRAA